MRPTPPTPRELGLREAEMEVGLEREARAEKPRKTRWRGEGAAAVRKAGGWALPGRLPEPGSCPFSTGQAGTGAWARLPLEVRGRTPSRRPRPTHSTPSLHPAPPVSPALAECVRPPRGQVWGWARVRVSCPHIYCTDFNQCLCPWVRLWVC